MLRDKIAIVTGGAQGIGKAIAARFLREGAKVVIADVDQEAGAEALVDLLALGEVHFVHADISREPDVARLVAEAVARFKVVDILINNAGIFFEKPLAELSLDEWNRVIGVNLTGAFLCARACAPHLQASHGRIVNIASTRAYQSEPHTEAYAASKGGLVALTHALAMSLGPAVLVNAIAPGWIEVGDWKKKALRRTPTHSAEDRRQHPAGRVGKPEDIAALAAFLCSGEAGFVTGTTIIADGGMTRKMIYV